MKNLIFILFLFLGLKGFSQADTALPGAQPDTIQPIPDSLVLKPTVILPMRFDSLVISNHPFYQFTNPVKQMESKRIWQGKEGFFYTVMLLLLFFAFIRNSFQRYMQDLFRLFFRTSVKQRQAKENLMQAPLPSLLMNGLFALSGGFFLALLFRHFKLAETYDFWVVFVYCAAGLAGIYIVKYVILKFTGLLFGVLEATDAYTFIIFTTNKILGIFLLPFIVIVALTGGLVINIAITLSFIMIGVLIMYRYFLAYLAVHRRVKIQPLHFLLYLLAFEAIPLLLINKVLFKYLA